LRIPVEEEVARRFFPKDFTDRERAIFEAGVALGVITHSLTGFPAAEEVKKIIESAAEKIFAIQPYRKKVKLRIVGIKKKRGVYGYDTLKPENLEISVQVQYGSATVTARMRYINELAYPLMYVAKISERKGGHAFHP